jgi:diguanylate cyclase (GGDEF)-like protein
MSKTIAASRTDTDGRSAPRFIKPASATSMTKGKHLVNNTEMAAPEKLALLSIRDWLPFVVLILSLLITYSLYDGARRNAQAALQAEFQARVRESNKLIEQRMKTYEQVLRGVVGLFAAGQKVTRDEFRRYVDTLQLGENYPGVQAIGFAPLVPAANKQAHIAAVRNEGFPGYDITPEGNRDPYVPVTYIEPLSPRNRLSLGFDMYSEPNNRNEMERARSNRQAVATPKRNLSRDRDTAPQYGFIIFLPAYRDTVPDRGNEQGTEDFLGWVYAPFRMHDLMHAIGGEESRGLDVEIYDGGELSPATRMYDSDPGIGPADADGKLTKADRIDFANHEWLVATTAQPAFRQRIENDRAVLILRGGVAFGFLLALLLWVSLDSRARAIQAARQALHLALYDTLTGLPNRKLFSERLAQAFAKSRRDSMKSALLFIDLDKFKAVNDDLGHAVGDLLLKQVAERLQHCTRESDTVGRFGGDEFVALLLDVEGSHGAQVVAEKMLQALSQPFDIAGHTVHIGGSIGVAIHPDNGRDQNSLIKNADRAMYEAKNSGRNTIRFAG